MEWSILFTKQTPPTYQQVEDYVNNSLWSELNSRLQTAYQIEPIMDYSSCSMQPGWNVKYKKSSKSLCTLYPMEGYFIALVVIGNKEMTEAEFLIPQCTGYVQDTFHAAKIGMGQKWLMLEVRSLEVLEDVLSLVALRRRPVM